MDLTAPVDVALTDSERSMILQALAQWAGPTMMSHDLAVTIGFADLDDFDDQLDRLTDAVRDRQALIPLDWKRLLLTTEICFASDYFGAGAEWETLTGLDDHTSLHTLRSIQHKLIQTARAVPPAHHEPPTNRPTDG